LNALDRDADADADGGGSAEHLHTQLLKPAVAELAVLENDMQLNYLTLLHQSRNT